MPTYGSGKYGTSPYGPPLQPAVPAKPLLASLYSFGGSFIKSLGPILNRPKFKWTLNAGGHPVDILLPARDTSANAPTPGNIIRLREDGGDGSLLYGGILQDIPEEVDENGRVAHRLTLDPMVVQTGYTPFTKNYAAATDIAQMVRDAVSQTDSLTWTSTSVPLTGITALNNFQYKWVVDVLEFARTAGGVNYFWFVDAAGVVWFQQASLSSAKYTFLRGQHYGLRKESSSNHDRKNYVVCVGRVPSQQSAPITSVYSGASRSVIGTRAAQQIYKFPTVSDQGTLNLLANTIGGVFDRQLNRVQFKVKKATFPGPIQLGQVGGATVRYSEILSSPLQESAASAGTYQGPYAVLDVEDDGESWDVIAADIPVSGIEDFKGTLDRIQQSTVLSDLTYTPAALNSQGVLNGGGIQTAPDTNNPARWKLDGTAFRGFDGSSTDYGLPDGAGETIYFGSNGIGYLAKLILSSAKTGARIVLDSVNAILKINDGTYDRVQQGNLAAYTDPNGLASPSGYGGRYLDANGNIIFDTSGLGSAFVLKANGSSTVVSFQDVTSTTWITLCSVTFTLTRPASILAFTTGGASVTAGTGNGNVGLAIDGTTPPGPTDVWANGDGHSNIHTTWPFLSLAAGTHTLNMVAEVSSGVTLHVTFAQCFFIQFGG